MSTPATLKQREIALKKAAKRNLQQLDTGLFPLAPRYPPRFYNYRWSRNIAFKVDEAGGRKHAGNESGNRKGNRGPRAPPKPLTLPQVEDLPIDVDTDDYKVEGEKVVCFNGRENFLSNLFPVVLTIESNEYPSVEHYYQACKVYTLAGGHLASQLRSVPDAGKVKMLAKKILRSANIPIDKIEEWKTTQGPVLLHHAIAHKFMQNPELREKLLETDDAILAHTYEHDNIFATGCDRDKMIEWAKANNGNIIKIPTKIDNDSLVYIPLVGKGKNILGFINMKVREQLRHFEETKFEAVDPIMLAAMETLQLNGPSSSDADE